MLVEEMTNVAVSGHLPGLQQHILRLQRSSWRSLGGGKDPLLSVGSAPLEKQAPCAPGPTPLILVFSPKCVFNDWCCDSRFRSLQGSGVLPR